MNDVEETNTEETEAKPYIAIPAEVWNTTIRVLRSELPMAQTEGLVNALRNGIALQATVKTDEDED